MHDASEKSSGIMPDGCLQLEEATFSMENVSTLDNIDSDTEHAPATTISPDAPVAALDILNFFAALVGTNASSDATMDVAIWLRNLFAGQSLSAKQIVQLCQLLQPILKEEPNCVYVRTPVTIAGDIHGQLHDLLELLRVGGMPPEKNYLFLGDYVDRGYFSMECFCLLACMKILYPQYVTLLRGNHETRSVTKVYGFYDECLRKFGSEQIWTVVTETFDYLPLTAQVEELLFCDHGGISRTANSISSIQDIQRFSDLTGSAAMTEILWSDPVDEDDGHRIDSEGWAPSMRGAGLVWTKKATDMFLHTNKLEKICRAHQVAQDGFNWRHEQKVCTVFSAPNYCYRCGNVAGLMCVDENCSSRFVTFRAAPCRGVPLDIRFRPDYFT